MSKIYIKVYQNKNKRSSSYGKYFGRVKHLSTIESATLCKHTAMDSGIEESQVAVVYDAQLKQMKELLCNGHPIKVEGLGTFKLGVTSEGWSEEDVKQRDPKFDPAKDDIRKHLSAKQVKRVHLLFTPCEAIKEQLRGVKFETDKSEWEAQMLKEKQS